MVLQVMLFAIFRTIDLIVIFQTLSATKFGADKMLRMISASFVIFRTRALNGFSAHGITTERLVRLVIVVITERLTSEDVERTIWEGFLRQKYGNASQFCADSKAAYLASRAAEAITVILPL